MTLLLVYLAIAIGVSFLCSILEAVLLSVTPSFALLNRRRQSDPAVAANWPREPLINYVVLQAFRLFCAQGGFLMAGW